MNTPSTTTNNTATLTTMITYNEDVISTTTSTEVVDDNPPRTLVPPYTPTYPVSFFSKCRSQDGKIKAILKRVRNDLNLGSRRMRYMDIHPAFNYLDTFIERTAGERYRKEKMRLLRIDYCIKGEQIKYSCVY